MPEYVYPLILLGALAILYVVARLISSRIAGKPFCFTCATIFMVLLVVSLLFHSTGPGNEFGAAAEFAIFFPVGLVFCLCGFVGLYIDHAREKDIGRGAVILAIVNGLVYIVLPIVMIAS